ncbi:tumor necrosis factor alpha-induced protein 2-like [Scyliorhinus canicula]|uniref:tumor necrosis factor alpha-induced protein 2-like n=1 Tax=Scyliorhinus canicula TaxID=7830 RepID=UPI0018F63615|nr:tumor necrosis factor alpha-induced protein 2-like [Scyliorhinus canicula]
MPILKSTLTRLSPTKLYGGPVKLHKEIILGSRMADGPNPFEEDLSNEMSPLAKDASQEKNPFFEEEDKETAATEILNRGPQTGVPTSPRKNSSEKPGVLKSSLRKVWEKSKMKARSPNEEKSEEKKSFFRLPSPLSDPDSIWKSPEKKKGRRESEELASPVKVSNGPEKKGPVDLESKTKMSFLKRNKVKAEPLPEQQRDAVPKVKEPLSVLEINNLIQKRDLVAADGHIIELEEECDRVKQQSPGGANTSKDSGRKEKDVALLYEALESELRKIVVESLHQALPAEQLEQMVQTIEEEEKADKAWANRGGVSRGGGRPRELRRKWREAVKGSVAERLPGERGSGPIDQCLRKLKEQTVSDLISVRKNLIPAYPKDYEVFNVYVRSYHEGLASCLSELGREELGIQELYHFLQWCHNDYFREVMGHEELTTHIRKQQLGPLLPTETVKKLEAACVTMVKSQITKNMEQELSTEQGKWKQGSGTFHSELANRVIQLLTEHVERSAAATEELGSQVALCCLCSLADFLQSFQMCVQGFYEQWYENRGSADWVVPQTIALVNVCHAFRDYIERLAQKVPGEGEEGKGRATVSLDKVLRGGDKFLTENLFDDLKPNFAKLLKKKWLHSSESFECITTSLKQHFNQLRKIQNQPYQVRRH